MIEFQITKTQYLNMARAATRRRFLIATATIWGPMWIVAWILFAIAEGDAWSDIGSLGVLLLVGLPLTLLFTWIYMASYSKTFAQKMFQALSSDGDHFDIQCQLEDGQLKYYNITRNKLYEIDLKTVKRIRKYKDFFTVELGKRIGYYIPLNSETENLYHSLKNS